MKSYNLPYLAWTHTDSHPVKVDRIRQALVTHPSDAIAIHYQWAMLCVLQDEDEFKNGLAAANYLVEHAMDAEDKSTGYELLAICHEHFKADNTTAIQYYRLSLEEDATNESSLFRLGAVYSGTRQHKEALQCFLSLEQIENGSCQTEVGECYLELEDYVQAEYYFKSALTSGATKEIYNGLGRCAAETNNSEQAMKYFQQSLVLAPDDAVTSYFIGLMYQRDEDYYRALHHYTKAVVALPAFSNAYNNIAVCYESLGDDPEAALAHFEKALGTAPTTEMRTQLYMNLTRFHAQRLNFCMQEHYQQQLLRELGFEPESE